MNVKQINSEIISGNWTNADLNSMIEAIKYARSNLARQVKGSIRVGDNVEFTNKTGRRVQGSVKKVAIKYITVDTGAGLWRVPANMLEVV
jgi:hypothetical protein